MVSKQRCFFCNQQSPNKTLKIVSKHNRKIESRVLNIFYIFGNQQSTLLTKHGQSAVIFTNKLFCNCHNVNIISHFLVDVKNSTMVKSHLCQ